jgi:glutamate-1-semialdehyde 2,1-aminomutase
VATTGLNLGSLEGLLAELHGDYVAAHPRSEELYERALKALPGGNSRSQLYFEPFPFYVDSAEGARLYDVDGNVYLDLVNNYTSLVHGHVTAESRKSLGEQLDRGTAFGAPTEVEIMLAEEIVARVESVDQVRFANSGTEACLYAIRTARVFTGRHDIIKADGGYHGGFESAQVSVKHVGAANESVAEGGVHPGAAGYTHIIPFNDTQEAVRIIEEIGPKCAALIIEPMQGSAGAILAEPGYLEAIRDATRRTGCLLVFDEVMTLRLGYGGLQGELGVQPDITAMGKIIGGGTPVGAYGGRADVMSVTDPRDPTSLMHAGTFNANPMTMAAGLDTLTRLDRSAVERINRRGDDLRDWINETCRAEAVPLVATGYGNAVQIHAGSTAPRNFREMSALPKLPLQVLFMSMLGDGVFGAPNRLLMTISTAMTEADLSEVKASLSTGFALLKHGGFRLASS